jgi:hypothetical protein
MWLFQLLVLAGIAAIASELFVIHKRIKNYYRILTPAILEWYEQRPGTKPPERDELDE